MYVVFQYFKNNNIRQQLEIPPETRGDDGPTVAVETEDQGPILQNSISAENFS
jgi:hypothetical protein